MSWHRRHGVYGVSATCRFVPVVLGRSEPRAVVVASPGAGLASEKHKETKEFMRPQSPTILHHLHV